MIQRSGTISEVNDSKDGSVDREKVRRAPTLRESALGVRADGILYDKRKPKMKQSTAYLDDISDLDENSDSISNSDVDKISSGSIS